MHFNRFRMTDFLTTGFMEKALELYGLKPINDFPYLTQELKRYRHRLLFLPKINRLFHPRETYSEEIRIDDNNFYKVTWSIPTARKTIIKHNLALQEFSLDELVNLVDKQCINTAHLDYASKNKGPIILALYPPMFSKTKLLILDGNHRVIAKHTRGQEKIRGYLLQPHLHLKAMLGEVDRTLYKIHTNYYSIACYIGGLLSEQELAEQLYLL